MKPKHTPEEVTQIRQMAESELPPNAVLSFDNDGNIVVKNRAFRRRRFTLPGNENATKKKVTKAQRKKKRKLGRR